MLSALGGSKGKDFSNKEFLITSHTGELWGSLGALRRQGKYISSWLHEGNFYSQQTEKMLTELK